MNKLILNTSDKKKTYEYIKAHIFTLHYSNKLKPNSIHSVSSAKIIVESEGNIKSFLVISPLILVDENGTINIWTSSSFNQTISNEEYIKDKKHFAIIKNELNILKSKLRSGITAQEIYKIEKYKSYIEIYKLNKKYINPEIGGGL